MGKKKIFTCHVLVEGYAKTTRKKLCGKNKIKYGKKYAMGRALTRE